MDCPVRQQASSSSPGESARRVLIVDDEDTNVMLLQELLASECDQLAVAGTGAEALELLDDFRPDLVLLDVMLPDIDGYEVCRQLRRDPRFHGVKVIMLSARSMPEDRQHGLSAGADDYLTKPFDFDQVLSGVRGHLDRAGT